MRTEFWMIFILIFIFQVLRGFSSMIDEEKEDTDPEDGIDQYDFINQTDALFSSDTDADIMSEMHQLQQQILDEWNQDIQDHANDHKIALEAENKAKAQEKEEKEKARQNLARNAAYDRNKANIREDVKSSASSGSRLKPMASSSNMNSRKDPSPSVQYNINDLINDSKSQGTAGVRTGPGTGSSVYSKVSESLLNTIGYSQKPSKHSQSNQRLSARLMRYQYPRCYARPVETIIKLYEDNSKTYYDVLSMRAQSNSINEKKLKAMYRMKALLVHPDKNPHMDAKTAFDYLQDAYHVLSSSQERADYHKQLLSQAKKRKMTWKKWRKRVSNAWVNWHARWLLFMHRIKNKQVMVEVGEILEGPKSSAVKVVHELQHLCLLPSVWDRVLYLHEGLYDHIYHVFLGVGAATILCGKSVPIPVAM